MSAGLQEGVLCDATFSRHIISLNDWWCQGHIRWRRAQWRTVLLCRWISLCYSEQMDVPDTVDVVVNTVPPTVLWNIIVSVVVVSWCGQGFTPMVVLPWWVNGALSTEWRADLPNAPSKLCCLHAWSLCCCGCRTRRAQPIMNILTHYGCFISRDTIQR